VAVALEGALKLKEISYIHAEAYAAGEMKHGPIALITPDVPVVVVATQGRTYEKVVSNIQEVRARGAQVIAIATHGDDEIRRHAEHVLYIPEVSEALSAIPATVPMQLLAYHIAKLRGCNVDQPRNLAKSVTVE
jgi:glucosamine--fructose-6-phosphate aminotransferase (isomerizing)